MHTRALAVVVAMVVAAPVAACGSDAAGEPAPAAASVLACRIAPVALVARVLGEPDPLLDEGSLLDEPYVDEPDEGTFEGIRSTCSWITGAPGRVRQSLRVYVYYAASDFAEYRRESGPVRNLDGIGDAAFVAGSPPHQTGLAVSRVRGRYVSISLNDNRRNRSATPAELRTLTALLRAAVKRLSRR